MNIGLIDVDGHNFPNLALMRISAWHKANGDVVKWWTSEFEYCDIVYMSKVFSDVYSQEKHTPMNCGKVIKGGTGYCIKLGKDGKEHFDQSKNTKLPDYIEKMFPDYSIYPQYNFAVAMTSRGCPRGCSFCHVVPKEGRCAVKVADVSDFWNGQSLIECCDPNITACKDKRELFQQYKETGVKICFNQGLDIRLLNDADIHDLNTMRIERLHFAWDNPNENLEQKFLYFKKKYVRPSNVGTVYCLTNFEDCSVTEHIERALARIYPLRDLGYKPYVMVYNKPYAPREIRDLQRWCNNRRIFNSCPNFFDYKPREKTDQIISGQQCLY